MAIGPEVNDRAECLRVAAALERFAVHPIGRALCTHAATAGIASAFALDVRETPGGGVEGIVEGRRYRLGTARFAEAMHHQSPPPLERTCGESVAWLASESGWLATFAFADSIRTDALTTINALRSRGLTVSMLSGDAPDAVADVAQRLSITLHEGAMTPARKREQIANTQQTNGRVAMVGDGVNDGPVLAQADVSFAVASATPLAHHAASIVLLDDRLINIDIAIGTAHRTMTIVRQNLAWAFAYNIASVPLAALGYVPPWLAGLGMAASSLAVVANSMRLSARPWTSFIS